jgi:hypothetical protein
MENVLLPAQLAFTKLIQHASNVTANAHLATEQAALHAQTLNTTPHIVHNLILHAYLLNMSPQQDNVLTVTYYV